jgi:hypothetical protein
MMGPALLLCPPVGGVRGCPWQRRHVILMTPGEEVFSLLPIDFTTFVRIGNWGIAWPTSLVQSLTPVFPGLSSRLGESASLAEHAPAVFYAKS